MSLSTVILEQNAWFLARQDEYYSWLMGSGHKGLSILLEDLSQVSQGAPIGVQSHSKYIFDDGKYSFLLVGVNGEVEKLSPGFELSEENTNIGQGEAIPSTIINVGAGMETVRYIPADSSYDFPLRDDRNSGTTINEAFLKVVDKLYEPYFNRLFPDDEAAYDEVGITIKEAFKELLMSNLAEIMVPAYHSVPWVELGEECGGEKEAYEWFVQQTFSDFSERALYEATDGLNAENLGEDPALG